MWNFFKALFLGAVGVAATTRPANAPAPFQPNNATRLNRLDVIALINWVNQRYFGGRMSAWVDDAAAIVFVESSGSYDPNATANVKAVRREPDGRTSYGLMQVLLPTAQDLYKKGYKAITPTPNNLMTQIGGVYYGLAYIDYLDRNFPSLLHTHADIIRAYNGGQGWKRSTRGQQLTAVYYDKWGRQYNVNERVA